MRSFTLLLLILLIVPALTGCVTVQPWERGLLSHPSMQTEARLGDGFRAHVLPIREGAIGGEGSMGGGCGCN